MPVLWREAGRSAQHPVWRYLRSGETTHLSSTVAHSHLLCTQGTDWVLLVGISDAHLSIKMLSQCLANTQANMKQGRAFVRLQLGS